jgi:hypothetical protein
MTNTFKKNRINRAASLAAARKQRGLVASTPSEYVKAERAALEYNIIALEAELAMLNSLSEMTDAEKFDELFDLFDKNKDAMVDVSELADGLRKLDDELTFIESIQCAIDDVANFDSRGIGKMSKEDFQQFVDVLVGAMGCSFHELSELLVMKVFFSNNHNSLEEQLASESLAEELSKVVVKQEQEEDNVSPTLVVVLNPE